MTYKSFNSLSDLPFVTFSIFLDIIFLYLFYPNFSVGLHISSLYCKQFVSAVLHIKHWYNPYEYLYGVSLGIWLWELNLLQHSQV